MAKPSESNESVKLSDSDVSGSELVRVRGRAIRIEDSELELRFDNCRLDGLELDDVRAHSTRFVNVDIRGLFVDDADLSAARLHNVDLSGASFDDINLAKASLKNVDLSNVSIEDANISGLTIDGIRIDELLRGR